MTFTQSANIFSENLVSSFNYKNLKHIYHFIKFEFDKKIKELLLLPDYFSIHCNNDIFSSRNLVVEVNILLQIL